MPMLRPTPSLDGLGWDLHVADIFFLSSQGGSHVQPWL